MEVVLMGLVMICSLTSLVCWILTLIKLYRDSVGEGIFGTICALYAMIIGFKRAGDWGGNHGIVMIVWLICAVFNMIMNVVMSSQAQ